MSWLNNTSFSIYSCFEKGCPTEKHWSVRDNTERHDGLWLFTFTSFQRDGRRCYEYLFARVKRNKMDSELLTCLLKFVEYFPDYLSELSRTLLRFCEQPLSSTWNADKRLNMRACMAVIYYDQPYYWKTFFMTWFLFRCLYHRKKVSFSFPWRSHC